MRFENQTFTTEVTLDYNEFVKCTFKGAVIHFGGGQFTVTECKFEGNGAFAFHDAALRTVNFLKLIRSVTGGDLILQILDTTPAPPPMNLN